MAETTALVSNVLAPVWVPIYAVPIVVALVWASYRTIARVFKWLTIVLGAYIITAFLTNVDWASAPERTIAPTIEWTPRYFAVLVAVFGTTMSPYLFFC